MAKLRDWLGFINLNRILFGFSRITVKELILLAQQSNWFELVEQWTGMHTDVNSMVQALNNPIKVFNFLSVGVFAARFVTQATMLAKHTFAPTGDEKIILSTGERFKQELYKRHCMMLNDLVWGSINLITNYNSILKLSASTANNLTVLFLFFDLSLLIYQAYLSSEEYQALKAQYNPDDPEHGPMYKRQLAALEIKKETTYRECYFNMVGALMFIGGFSASFLLATPPAIVTGYFVCTLGVAMYLTSSAFSDYQKQALVLKNYQALAGDGADIADADIQKAMTAMQDARQVFMVTMAKNIVMPMLIMGVFAISWEVALIITAGYMAFECTKGYLGKPESVPEDGRELIHNMGIDSLSDNESDGGQPGALFLQPLPSSPELFAGK